MLPLFLAAILYLTPGEVNNVLRHMPYRSMMWAFEEYPVQERFRLANRIVRARKQRGVLDGRKLVGAEPFDKLRVAIEEIRTTLPYDSYESGLGHWSLRDGRKRRVAE